MARLRGKRKHKPEGKTPYKVVFEQITQEKKKLITVVSFEAKPPSGYTFIPAGNPDLTSRCKQLAKEDSARVLIVTTTKHKGRIDLSFEVNRIGYHFPSYIVARACATLGIDLSQSGHVLRRQQEWFAQNANKQRLRKYQVSAARHESPGSGVPQATLDIQAAKAIKDLFPKIPEKDIHKIVGRAFQKGTGRVGSAAEMSLPHRVQLAVVAHIRHIYTNYDDLLRKEPYQVARQMIEQACLDKLVEWRGDDEINSDPYAMEDILREVIVIPDDDEDEAESVTEIDERRFREGQEDVEIISSHANADDVLTEPLDYEKEGRNHDPLSDLRAPPGASTRYLEPTQWVLDRGSERMERHRHQAWKEALGRRRRIPTPEGTINLITPSKISESDRNPTDSLKHLDDPIPPFQQVSQPIHQYNAKTTISTRIGSDKRHLADMHGLQKTQLDKDKESVKQIPLWPKQRILSVHQASEKRSQTGLDSRKFHSVHQEGPTQNVNEHLRSQSFATGNLLRQYERILPSTENENHPGRKRRVDIDLAAPYIYRGPGRSDSPDERVPVPVHGLPTRRSDQDNVRINSHIERRQVDRVADHPREKVEYVDSLGNTLIPIQQRYFHENRRYSNVDSQDDALVPIQHQQFVNDERHSNHRKSLVENIRPILQSEILDALPSLGTRRSLEKFCFLAPRDYEYADNNRGRFHLVDDLHQPQEILLKRSQPVQSSFAHDGEIAIFEQFQQKHSDSSDSVALTQRQRAVPKHVTVSATSPYSYDLVPLTSNHKKVEYRSKVDSLTKLDEHQVVYERPIFRERGSRYSRVPSSKHGHKVHDISLSQDLGTVHSHSEAVTEPRQEYFFDPAITEPQREYLYDPVNTEPRQGYFYDSPGNSVYRNEYSPGMMRALSIRDLGEDRSTVARPGRRHAEQNSAPKNQGHPLRTHEADHVQYSLEDRQLVEFAPRRQHQDHQMARPEPIERIERTLPHRRHLQSSDARTHQERWPEVPHEIIVLE